jgi:hypothetical protein
MRTEVILQDSAIKEGTVRARDASMCESYKSLYCKEGSDLSDVTTRYYHKQRIHYLPFLKLHLTSAW